MKIGHESLFSLSHRRASSSASAVQVGTQLLRWTDAEPAFGVGLAAQGQGAAAGALKVASSRTGELALDSRGHEGRE
jgi:hypothetical protein